MKILSNSDYKDLNDQIKIAESNVRDRDKKIKNNNEKIEMQKLEIEKLKSTIKELEKKVDNCHQNMLSKNHEYIKLEQELLKEQELKQYFRSSNGGLIKENNKLKNKVYILETNLNNFKKFYQESYKKKSVNEYDKRLKSIMVKE